VIEVLYLERFAQTLATLWGWKKLRK